MSIRRKCNGKWVVDFYDQSGIRRRETVKGLRADAQKRLNEIQLLVDSGSYLPQRDLPGFDIVANNWLDSKSLNVRHTSLGQYQGHVNKHLSPFFSNIRFNNINLSLIEKFMRKHIEGGHSIQMTRKVLTTLNSIMKYAVRHRYISYNPMIDLERPKDRNKINSDSDIKPKFITVDQVKSLLEHSGKFKPFFMMAVLTGMRQGELLGLKWKDILWEKNQVHVQRTFNHGKFYPPKTKNSDRYIDLAPHLIFALRKWKRICPPGDLYLIFPRATFWSHVPDGRLEQVRAGLPTDKGQLWRNAFLPLLKMAGLPRVTFHSLRHTYASLLIAQGENPKYIMKQMGHSTISVTFDLYGHLMEETNKQSAEKLGHTVLGALSA